MTKRIVQTKKIDSILEKKVSRIQKNEKALDSYVVKTKSAGAHEVSEKKNIKLAMNDMAVCKKFGSPIIAKALQQKEKYVKKGGSYLMKREIGTRY